MSVARSSASKCRGSVFLQHEKQLHISFKIEKYNNMRYSLVLKTYEEYDIYIYIYILVNVIFFYKIIKQTY